MTALKKMDIRCPCLLYTSKEVIRQTIFSIADTESNKLMTGELFEVEDHILKVVSLDGHRISIRKIELKASYDHKKVVVPGKMCIRDRSAVVMALIVSMFKDGGQSIIT